MATLLPPPTPKRGWIEFSGIVLITVGLSGGGALAAATKKREFRTASLTGDGQLSATLKAREFRDAALTGNGVLAAPYALIQNTVVAFGSTGTLFAFGLPFLVDSDLGGEGTLAFLIDGLTATAVPGTPFGGEGSLSATTDGLTATAVAAQRFIGDGTLSIAVDGLTATAVRVGG